jgi:hypothetical protein
MKLTLLKSIDLNCLQQDLGLSEIIVDEGQTQ